MSDFLKKLQNDLTEGVKTDYVNKFNEIVEQSEHIDINKVKEKLDDIDFEELGIIGTPEDVEKSRIAQEEFLKEQSEKEAKEFARAQILHLVSENKVYRLTIQENEKIIDRLEGEYFKQYGEFSYGKETKLDQAE